MHGRPALASLALVRPFGVITVHPCIQVSLQFFDPQVNLFAESNGVKFILDGFVEAFADAVGLGMLGLGLGMVDVVQGQKQLILVPVRPAAVLGSPVGQHPVQRSAMFLEEGNLPWATDKK